MTEYILVHWAQSQLRYKVPIFTYIELKLNVLLRASVKMTGSDHERKGHPPILTYA